MAGLRCEAVSDGLRASQAIASVRDHYGRRHFIRIERDFLSAHNSEAYLPVGVVRINSPDNVALIELPHEAETGANRLWVRSDQLQVRTESFIL